VPFETTRIVPDVIYAKEKIEKVVAVKGDEKVVEVPCKYIEEIAVPVRDPVIYKEIVLEKDEIICPVDRRITQEVPVPDYRRPEIKIVDRLVEKVVETSVCR
jgi:hypothetical protein